MSVKGFLKKIKERKPWFKKKELRKSKRSKYMDKEIFNVMEQKHLETMAFSIVIFALTKGKIRSVNELNVYQALWQMRESNA